MGFGQEMRDFVDAAEAGVRMQGNWQNMQAQRIKNRRPPGEDPNVLPPSSLTPGTGGGVGTVDGTPAVEGQPRAAAVGTC